MSSIRFDPLSRATPETETEPERRIKAQAHSTPANRAALERNRVEQAAQQYRMNDEPAPARMFEERIATELKHLPPGGKLEIAADASTTWQGVKLKAGTAVSIERLQDGRTQLAVSGSAGVGASADADAAKVGADMNGKFKRSVTFDSDAEAADSASAILQYGFNANPFVHGFTEGGAEARYERILAKPAKYAFEVSGDVSEKLALQSVPLELKQSAKAAGAARITLDEATGVMKVAQEVELSAKGTVSEGAHSKLFTVAESRDVVNATITATVEHEYQLTPEQVKQAMRDGSFGELYGAALGAPVKSKLVQKFSVNAAGDEMTAERAVKLNAATTMADIFNYRDATVAVREGVNKRTAEVKGDIRIAEVGLKFTKTEPGQYVGEARVGDLLDGAFKGIGASLDVLRARANATR